MKADFFSDYPLEPAKLVSFVRDLLKKYDFATESENSSGGVAEIHARKNGIGRAAKGQVRDIDVVVAGTTGKLHAQLRVGIWGRDLLVPVLESIPTLGLAGAEELRSARELESKMWEELVHWIDPALLICNRDGETFKTQEDLNLHLDMHRMLKETEKVQRTIVETGLMEDL